jgi:hypothetical protein
MKNLTDFRTKTIPFGSIGPIANRRPIEPIYGYFGNISLQSICASRNGMLMLKDMVMITAACGYARCYKEQMGLKRKGEAIGWVYRAVTVFPYMLSVVILHKSSCVQSCCFNVFSLSSGQLSFLE